MTFKTCDFYGMLRLVIAVLIGPFMHGTSRLDAGPIVVVGDVQPASRLPVTEIGHTEWDRLLQRYVNGNGLVNYSAWKASSEDGLALDRYLANLSQSQWPPQNAMDVSTRSAVIAYWINAYNAVTIRGILKEYPTTSIRNHTSVLLGYNIWKDLRLAVDGRQVSLDQMEHEILRTMKEPRIHFAIVCASRGCPTLRRQAYNAVDLETQLAENARDFFARSRHFLFDPSTREFHLSAILNWFGGDFGADQATQLQAIAQWLSPGEAKRVAEQGGGRVKYRDYDWGLNDLRVMTIDHSITLDARQTYDELRIIASDIVVDGKGVVMRGSDHEDPSTFTGTAIAADGVSGVTLKGISAHGYETGLKVRNASTWTVDHCDFSRNFHDPKFGWGENGRRGGIVWENVERSVLRDCRATRVWDACVLVDSHDNRIERNDLSHTSNTGLKLQGQRAL